jgi:hypothetical protein
VFTTELNEPLRVQYPTLRQLVSFEVRLAKAVAVLELTRILLSQLNTFVSTTPPDSMSDLATPELVTQIHNHQLQCDTYTTTAGFIRQRAQTSAQLLSNTLSFHDQNISNEQNANMFRLNKSAVFITTLTLVYLPASFVAVSRTGPPGMKSRTAADICLLDVLWDELLLYERRSRPHSRVVDDLDLCCLHSRTVISDDGFLLHACASS